MLLPDAATVLVSGVATTVVSAASQSFAVAHAQSHYTKIQAMQDPPLPDAVGLTPDDIANLTHYCIARHGIAVSAAVGLGIGWLSTDTESPRWLLLLSAFTLLIPVYLWFRVKAFPSPQAFVDWDTSQGPKEVNHLTEKLGFTIGRLDCCVAVPVMFNVAIAVFAR
jgi:hypothetical protein